jgi:hypothetical protein
MVCPMAGRRIKRSVGGWAGRIAMMVFAVLVAAPVALLLIFRFLPVPGTPEMLLSLIEGKGRIMPGPIRSIRCWAVR